MFGFVSRIFKIREWADWQRNQHFIEYLRNVTLKLLKVQNFDSSKAKKFEVISKRYHLEEDQLALQAKSLRSISLVLLAFTLLLIALAVYYVFMDKWVSASLVGCVVLIPLALAFRYHFYYTLIIQRRLNCSIKEWFVLTFLKSE